MMEKMENNKETKVKKLTKAQLEAKEEKIRQKIAFNLDNYTIATDICLAILENECVAEDVKIKTNEVLLATLEKIKGL
jgi:hypothetical protein